MTKHFLYLTNDRMVSLVWQNGKVIHRESFLAADPETASVATYIARHKRLATYVVTDLVEEDFRLDTIPHLRSADAEAVTTRKLSQLYRASTLRNAVLQGRETEGRRDDRVMYHAVANTSLVEPWLSLLEKNAVPVEGVYSSAVLSAHLLKPLELQHPHTLLVTVVPDFGLRQTYFQNRHVKFSRITPIVYDEGQSVGALIAAETNRTWQYLDSLRQFSGGETLEVCVLVHARDRAVVADAVRSYPLRRYRFLDIGEAAASLGLSPAPSSSHAEQLLVQAFAKAPIRNHFAEPRVRRFATFRRARNVLFGATAAVLALGIAGTAFHLYQAAQLSSRIDARENSVRKLEAEYQAVVNTLRTSQLASDVVRDTSAFYTNEMRTQPAAPGAFLRDISTVIGEFPRVTLLQVAWSTNNDSKANLPMKPMPKRSTLEITSRTGAREEPGERSNGATPVENESPPWRGTRFQIAMIDAAIKPFDGNFRATLDEVARFATRLNTVPGLKARVEQLPLDVGPAARLEATGRRSGKPPEARFVIRIVRDVGGA